MAAHDHTGQPLPTQPCSVVWSDGHPWVLDGEPGIPGTRRWVGLDDDGAPRVRTHQQMTRAGWSLIYQDRDTAGFTAA